MCQRRGETVDHLLIHHDVAYDLWSFVIRMIRIYWVLPRRLVDLLSGRWNWFGKHSSEIWNFASLYV